MDTLAVVIYLLPFVTLALVLGFLWLAARMAKEPAQTDSQAEDEAARADEWASAYRPPVSDEADAERSIIRVTREHSRYSAS
ncbi:MAG TPA: hypothetical protein VFA18_08555 [Gemmataceae bacterium]|nr:hypothetical protein [Gemmataceae bacterium]